MNKKPYIKNSLKQYNKAKKCSYLCAWWRNRRKKKINNLRDRKKQTQIACVYNEMNKRPIEIWSNRTRISLGQRRQTHRKTHTHTHTLARTHHTHKQRENTNEHVIGQQQRTHTLAKHFFPSLRIRYMHLTSVLFLFPCVIPYLLLPFFHFMRLFLFIVLFLVPHQFMNKQASEKKI